MYARFLFALAIAASIFTISAVSRAAVMSQTSVIRVEAMDQIASTQGQRARGVRLPTVVVHPDREAARLIGDAQSARAAALSAVDGAHSALLGARTRVARVSMRIPYYSFGGGAARGVE
jgi:hypothetical protein